MDGGQRNTLPAATDAVRKERIGAVSPGRGNEGRDEGEAREDESSIRGEQTSEAQAAVNAVTIYHNPRCGTSRKTLELIRAKGIEPAVIEYLRHPPSASELDRILLLLKMEPRELMRKKEDEYKGLKLDRPELTRRQLINAMVEHPILIERPIVLSKSKAALGRPPENVSAIL